MGRRSSPNTSRARWAFRRLYNVLRPAVVVAAPPSEAVAEWDVPVSVRDGTVLRVNVFRPPGSDPVPVILSAHPYGKDRIPARTRSGRGVNFQYRLFPQPDPVQFSAWTSWEAPDPAFWVARGYAVVNADLRGAGTSDGVGELLSESEALDVADLIEWAGTQPWSTGKVGLDGVSYLAIVQYRVAALRPAHLAAICPWEGFSDLYRDFARPGGVREDGFSVVWSKMTRRAARVRGDLRREIVRRPELDDWYDERTPRLEDIEVPMLVCGSFSDHCLHSRGSFEAFRRVGSTRRWLYTHRGGKWSEYYGTDATETRARFFDHVLKDADNGWAAQPPVRLAVHEAGPRPVQITDEGSWPPADLEWTTLHLDNRRGQLAESPVAASDQTVVSTRRGSMAWRWVAAADLDVLGPMVVRLHVELVGIDDAHLFVGVRKLAGGREVTFEGSYGFSRDMVTNGWQRVAHRALDDERSTPTLPVHTHRRAEPVRAGEIVSVEVALRDHATRLRAGDELRLELRGRWPYRRDPMRGQFPAGYERSPKGLIVVHAGGPHDATLLFGHRPVAVAPPR